MLIIIYKALWDCTLGAMARPGKASFPQCST